ncbi:MAG: hypothetical protein SFV32_00860 [Opitutaceae bacterium]|nr:hypothetical protein [Opitutaceae bacterium]
MACASSLIAQPLRPLAANPRYLEWKGKPIVLVASGEHYGSVVNPDFDFYKYLDTIAADNLNHTRIFLGDYVEEEADFGIADNPLMVGDKFLAPWARSETPGFTRGGNKFDLERWNPAYFERLHAFLDACEKKGVTVEAVLFFAGAVMKNHPMAAHNNVNGTTPITAKQYLTLENGNVLKYQEAYARKLTRELNRHTHVILNLCNEPWFDHQEYPGFTSKSSDDVRQWIGRVSEWVVDEESRLPNKHVLSVDLTNQGYEVSVRELDTVFRHVAAFNVHYDANADILKRNRGVARAFCFNETGFNGIGDDVYRVQGWNFLFNGGAMYGNLDFSFTVTHPDGTAIPRYVTDSYDCGGSPSLRRQLGILSRFFESLPIAAMRPDNSMVIGGPAAWVGLSDPGRCYAVWFPGEGEMLAQFVIPKGKWRLDWVNIMTGETRSEEVVHTEWAFKRKAKREGGGVAVRITAVGDEATSPPLEGQSGSSRVGEKK